MDVVPVINSDQPCPEDGLSEQTGFGRIQKKPKQRVADGMKLQKAAEKTKKEKVTRSRPPDGSS